MTDKLDALLKNHLAAGADDPGSAQRVLTALAAPLPRQRGAWRRLPGALLDWQFAPAWPRVAVLAACAGIGFVVGLGSMDYFDGTPSPFASAAASDVTALFEPEPVTGARP
ncbi:MAG: hypothetical protein JOZ70_05905 [Pseudolabrys sp.]|nr:hypothetical protein [Pseudolabrys sp.]MBV9954763.1 hypothetical protein [Pseudolabrys sp.]